MIETDIKVLATLFLLGVLVAGGGFASCSYINKQTARAAVACANAKMEFEATSSVWRCQAIRQKTETPAQYLP
jgi:hypothetical protein